MEAVLPRHVCVIVNPTAGAERPILRPLNSALHRVGIDWDFRVTRGSGDARCYAAAAAARGVDAVVIYGGDGTVMEAAAGLVGTRVPLGIVPGGSANVVATELGIPRDARAACELLCGGAARVRRIDLGQVLDGRGDVFAARVGMGFDARIVRTARSEPKDRVGLLAYWLAAGSAWRRTVVSRYRITLDGRAVETEGSLCAVTNAGNVGRRRMRLAPGIDIADGKLDVVVWRGDSVLDLLRVGAGVLIQGGRADVIGHWQAREIGVEADPPQLVEVDGEPAGRTPVRARVRPGVLYVLAPS